MSASTRPSASSWRPAEGAPRPAVPVDDEAAGVHGNVRLVRAHRARESARAALAPSATEPALGQVRAIPPLPERARTGRPVVRSTRCGRSSLSQRDTWRAAASTTTAASNSASEFTASCTAAIGSGSPTRPWISRPAASNRSSALFMCASASSPPECMSAAQATPWGVAGTSRVKRVGAFSARSFSAASSSSDSAVRFATTRTCAFSAMQRSTRTRRTPTGASRAGSRRTTRPASGTPSRTRAWRSRRRARRRCRARTARRSWA